MTNSPEELKSTFELAGQKISKLKGKKVELAQSAEQREKRMKKDEQSLRDL